MRGDRLREIRKTLGHSQESLAELLNTTTRQISRYENNATTPDADTIVRIASSLDVSADYLLGLSNDPTPDHLSGSELSTRERYAIAAWRRGDYKQAIKTIVADE